MKRSNKFKNEGRKWQPEDDFYLMSKWNRMSRKELAYDLGRTTKAIGDRHSILKKEAELNKLKGNKVQIPSALKIKKGKRCGGGYAWSDDELEFITKNWGIISIYEMTNSLDRTEIAIHLRGRMEELPKIYPDPRYNPFYVPAKHGWKPDQNVRIETTEYELKTEKPAEISEADKELEKEIMNKIPVTNGKGEVVDHVEEVPIKVVANVTTESNAKMYYCNAKGEFFEDAEQTKPLKIADIKVTNDNNESNVIGIGGKVPATNGDPDYTPGSGNALEKVKSYKPEEMLKKVVDAGGNCDDMSEGQSLVVDHPAMEKAGIWYKFKCHLKAFLGV